MECNWDASLLQRSDQLPAELIQAIQHGSNEEYLRILTKTALDARYTDLIFAHCGDIFAHLCASFREHGTFVSSLAALGRVVPFAPFLTPLATHLLQSERHVLNSSQSSDDDLLYLLGLYRLLCCNRTVFQTYVRPAELVENLGQSRPKTYLIIRILQLCLSGADEWLENAISRYLGEDDPEVGINGQWDERTIDYRFLSLWENERHETMKRMLADALNSLCDFSLHVRVIPKDLLCRSASLVGNVLLPRVAQDIEIPQTSHALVMTRTVTANLHSLSQALKCQQPILLSGVAGSGKTSLIHHVASDMGALSTMITLHVNEQTDAKLLLGIYTTGSTPGTFVWKPGVLTTAVQEGRWILIEDLDRAPNDVLGTILPLIERQQLLIPTRKAIIHAAEGFRIFATVRSFMNNKGEETRPLSHMLGHRHWERVSISLPSPQEHASILLEMFPVLSDFLPQIMDLYQRASSVQQQPISIHQPRTGVARGVTFRDLLKLGQRLSTLFSETTTFTTADFDSIFLETLDCLAGSLPEGPAKTAMADTIAQGLQINPQRRDYLLTGREIPFQPSKSSIRVGRYSIPKVGQTKAGLQSFSTNPHTCRVLERVAAGFINREPLLLVGETGVGKTTAVQQLASLMGKNLVPFNLSQQSEVGDLLGGFKPLNIRTVITPMRDDFDVLFMESFSTTKNRQFLELFSKKFASRKWKAVCKLWRQACKMVEQQRGDSSTEQAESPAKKRKIESKRTINFGRWERFATRVAQLEAMLNDENEAIAFTFVEGNIVKAVRNGDWVLLDEINLASPDTLESISDLLDPTSPSLLLTESGDVERVQAHPDFRIFAAMNPATDVGKKDLPPGIRSRFTELHVDSPEKDPKSLRNIVEAYLRSEIKSDTTVASDVSTLFTKITLLAQENRLVDGAGQKPYFSLRTLTRTLTYAKIIQQQCSLRRALYEGFQMSFVTFLDTESAALVLPEIQKHLFGKHKNVRSELTKNLRMPDDGAYVQGFAKSKHWIKQGGLAPEEQPQYIITRSVEANLENLIRAASTRKFPVLIQGPTSSGKTSMIEYLARRTGHQFVRINNHEHTDLQEYLGTYVSGTDGRLTFQEGVLVKSLREGHWLVLDELNLAPTDVLEALNRLLDDNQEILIPETQETVRPHPNFMLFATQNPAGLYGGRKTLSRAFRNRFLELHFDDIPIDELQEILHRRTLLPESRCQRIVNVYKELSVLRQENRLFEQKSFATLRDLFRWALRCNDTIEQLASNGYMLLCERVRKEDERAALKRIINEKIIGGRDKQTGINEDILFGENAPEIFQHDQNVTRTSVVWTKAMRRLYVLVCRAIQNNEPVLLVGETGCGKTTVCQMLAEALKQKLHTVNAHQNTETGDLIGSQRPLRNRAGVEASLRNLLRSATSMQLVDDFDSLSTDELLKIYDQSISSLSEADKTAQLQSSSHAEISQTTTRFRALFEWVDGSLVQAMRQGDLFLLDEISLADDSVLERINSVLESQRTMFLAEKGTLDASVTAKPGFQFFATMNPGGDYGKRELSPALRNRFTEIWVPALSDLDDVLQIVHAKLNEQARPHASGIVRFASWFKCKFDASSASSISIRDTLAWIQFINLFASSSIEIAVVHGAAMVYIDTLGANPAGLISLESGDIDKERAACLLQLSKLTGLDSLAIYNAIPGIFVSTNAFGVGPFQIPRSQAMETDVSFNFQAPTTRSNALRVLRALQLNKPIMLEGSPGVGKTALVTAITVAAGMPLTRINLSDQTDLLDLFGSDTPIEGASSGIFQWRDAPFLRAMKNGEWVLLDEMNLASQSVLEGLNACLDHRGEVFVPELGQTFSKHPSFRLFAAQNPHHQGGGRKGLPASFVNRFIVVYADSFKPEDLTMICKQAYPSLQELYINSAVTFLEKLNDEIADKRSFGIDGGPWEFNLRDLSRWLSLASSNTGLLQSANPMDLIDIIFLQRLRTDADRMRASSLIQDVYTDCPTKSDLYFNVSPKTVQVGIAMLERHPIESASRDLRLGQTPLSQDMRAVQSVMLAVAQSWPVVLVGPSGCGKTVLIESLASAVGSDVVTLAMSADTDALDLLGGYEQHDSIRQQNEAFSRLRELVNDACKSALQQGNQNGAVLLLQFLHYAVSQPPRVEHLKDLLQHLPAQKHAELESLLDSLHPRQDFDRARFEWVDGPLIEALQSGKWLILDNANLCSAAVLDRLNSLLEPGGVMFVNEHSDSDGKPTCVRPHPNFRIFLTMDPKHGELSRAMRNRAVEIFLRHQPSENAACLSRLQTESAIARFSALRSATSQGGESNPYHSEVGLHHLAFRDQRILARFQKQFENGLFLRNSDAHSMEELALKKTRFMTETMSKQIRKVYCDMINSMGLPSGLEEFQPLHSLLNQVLVSAAPDTLHQAMSVAVRSDVALSLHSLSERIEIAKRDRSIALRLSLLHRRRKSKGKQDPGMLQRLALLLNQFTSFVDRISTVEIAYLPQIRVSLARVFSITHTLLAALVSSNVTEALIDACVAAGHSILISEARALPSAAASSFNETASSLSTIVHTGDHLGAYRSTKLLWKLARQHAPLTSDNLKKLLHLETIVDIFDDSFSDFKAPLSQVVKLRRAFQRAATPESLGSLDLQNLPHHPIATTSTKGRDILVASSPHFKACFEYLCQHFTRLMLDQRVLQDEETSILEILAGRKTLETACVDDPNPTENPKHVLRLVGSSIGANAQSMIDDTAHEALQERGRGLLETALQCMKTADTVPLRNLSLLQSETQALGTIFATRTNLIATDEIIGLDAGLRKLLSAVLDALAAHENPLQARCSALKRCLELSTLKERTDDTHRTLKILPSHDAIYSNFRTVLEYLIAPHEDFIPRLKQSAQAWACLAVACLHTYIPGLTLDPVQEEDFQQQIHLDARNKIRLQLEAVRHFRVKWLGEAESLLSRVLQQDLDLFGTRPESSQEYRPQDSSLSQLLNGLQTLHSLVLNMQKDPGNLEQASSNDWQNIKILRKSLHSSQRAFADLAAPAVGFIDCLLTAKYLSHRALTESDTVSDSRRLHAVTPLMGSSMNNWLDDNIHVQALNTCRSTEEILHCLRVLSMRLSVAQASTLSTTLKHLVENTFSRFYELWKKELGRDQRATAAKSSLYKYRGADETQNDPTEEELAGLFPEADDTETSGLSKITELSKAQVLAPEIAALYHAIYRPEAWRVADVVDAMVQSTDLPLAGKDHYNCDGNRFPVILHRLHELNIRLSTTATKSNGYNIYTDMNEEQCRILVSLLERTQTRFTEIHNAWPDHATPVDVLRICEAILDITHSKPLTHYLPFVEKAHSTIAEWQRVASTEFSAANFQEELMDLVVSWRRLELSTWASLFDFEDKSCAQSAASWWFVAFETIVQAHNSYDSNGMEHEFPLHQLTEVLGSFLSGCGLGEYQTRISMLRDFYADITRRSGNLSTSLGVALASTITYYSHYESLVSERLRTKRAELEKQIKEIIQLASWKDRNVEILKSSAKSSHKKLFRIVRKYRLLLSEAVAPLIFAEPPRAFESCTSNALEPKNFYSPLSDHACIRDKSQIDPRFFAVSSSTTQNDKFDAQNIVGATTAPAEIEDFLAGLTSEMNELRKATPKFASEENKSLVQHLKTRKRRLLADVLKSLRKMGFQHSLSDDVLSKQRALHIVLSETPCFPNQGYSSGNAKDLEFYRLLHIMPSVRQSSSGHSEDLTPAEVARCRMLLESLLQLSVHQHKLLGEKLRDLAHIREISTRISALNRCEGPTWGTGSESLAVIVLDRIAGFQVATSAATKFTLAQKSLGGHDYTSILADLNQASVRLEAASKELQHLEPLPTPVEDSQVKELCARIASTQDEIVTACKSAIEVFPELGPTLSSCLRWIEGEGIAVASPNSVVNEKLDLETWVGQLNDLGSDFDDGLAKMVAAFGKIDSSDTSKAWVIEHQDLLQQALSNLNIHALLSKFSEMLENLQYVQNMETPQSLSRLVQACTKFKPVVEKYCSFSERVLSEMCDLHAATNRMATQLATIFIQLAKDGFCTPQEKSDENDARSGQVETGTGLGDGEGAEDISKDIGADEDLGELAQDATDREQDQEMDAEKDAVDMADEELAGEFDNAENDAKSDEEQEDDGEGEDRELDEETGQVDGDDPNAVDEKTWNDGTNTENQEKEAEQAQGTRSEDVAATENAEQEMQDEQLEEGAPEEAEMGVEQSVDQPETADPHMKEEQTLDLPEDMNMDGEDPNLDDESDADGGDDLGDEGDESAPIEANDERREAAEGSDVGSEEMEDLQDDDQAPMATELEEQPQDNEGEEDAASDDAMLDDQEEKQHPTDGLVADETEGAYGNDSMQNEGKGQTENIDEQNDQGNSDPTQQTDPQTGASDGLNQEGDASNTASYQASQPQRKNQFQKLGDFLDEWYNQHHDIQSAQPEKGQDSEASEQQNTNATQFEHLPDAMDSSLQALGAASVDQSTSLDYDKAVDIDMQDEKEADAPPQEEEQSKTVNEEVNADLDMEDNAMRDDVPLQVGENAMIGHPNDNPRDAGDMEADDEMKDIVDDVDDQLSNTHLVTDDALEMLSPEEARQLWAEHEARTRNMAVVLTEHLRLILQPTQATKMRGDFRTGKRLNIKKIIPYIASSYKRDKIWMRRSQPSKRAYQVMLAIDDSQSMAERQSNSLAFDTMALVARSLAMLEVGELCILGFGGNVHLAHPFTLPFTSNAGADTFRHFRFDQKSTNVHQMVRSAIDLFRSARLRAASATAELWQLLLIISDGVCDDHETLRQLVRQAQDERIMVVFIVVDASAKSSGPRHLSSDHNDSIMNLKRAEFVKGPDGEMQPRITKYIDTFPFQYYLIVKDVVDLPNVLAGALRQWFAEVTGASGS